MTEQHTSGAQRAAEHEATAEQLAEWGRRLQERAEQLERELRDLATAAASHGTTDAGHIAGRARAASDVLAGSLVPWSRPSPLRATGTPAAAPSPLIHGHGDRPPFADDLVTDRPPHEHLGGT